MRGDAIYMDINQLSALVRSHLLDSDEVIVPGLGTFRAEVVPAAFSDNGFTVNPPYRKLTFVQEELPSANKLEADPAYIESLKKDLAEARSIDFPGLGKLRLTKSDQYFFVPDEDTNIYPEGFGLAPVSLKNKDARSESGTAGEDSGKTGKSGKSRKTPREKKPRNPKRTAIIIAVVIVDIILIAIVALRVLGAVAPDFVDKLLYTPEELEILHSRL